jgi:hypothetical protein
MKKNEQNIYQSNLLDIKINMHKIKSASPYIDFKALRSTDIGRKSSILSQHPKPNNVSYVLNYLNKYIEHDKQKLMDSKEFLNESSLHTFKTALNNGNTSAYTNNSTTSATTNNNHQVKSRMAPIENNEAFKYLKKRLANKHYETISRPNFNVAVITPNPQADKLAKDFYERKFDKRYFYCFDNYDLKKR